jgi:hypothetical protein
LNANIFAARAGAGVFDHVTKAADAAWTAASTSAAPHIGTRAISSPREGLWTAAEFDVRGTYQRSPARTGTSAMIAVIFRPPFSAASLFQMQDRLMASWRKMKGGKSRRRDLHSFTLLALMRRRW